MGGFLCLKLPRFLFIFPPKKSKKTLFWKSPIGSFRYSLENPKNTIIVVLVDDLKRKIKFKTHHWVTFQTLKVLLFLEKQDLKWNTIFKTE